LIGAPFLLERLTTALSLCLGGRSFVLAMRTSSGIGRYSV
jgi:hypothetical protein